MTELNIAYSYNGNEMMDDKQSDDINDYQQQSQQSQQQQQQSPIQQSPIQQSPIQQSPIQQSPIQQLPINNSYYMNQVPIQQQQIIKKQQVIVLGISIFQLVYHYLTQYLSDNILSSTQEFIVRISYPILIFLLLWIIKSL